VVVKWVKGDENLCFRNKCTVIIMAPGLLGSISPADSWHVTCYQTKVGGSKMACPTRVWRPVHMGQAWPAWILLGQRACVNSGYYNLSCPIRSYHAH
jgi:hypothetical protein